MLNVQWPQPFLSEISFESEINKGEWSVDRASNMLVPLTIYWMQLETKIWSDWCSINLVEWFGLIAKF